MEHIKEVWEYKLENNRGLVWNYKYYSFTKHSEARYMTEEEYRNFGPIYPDCFWIRYITVFNSQGVVIGRRQYRVWYPYVKKYRTYVPCIAESLKN